MFYCVGHVLSLLVVVAGCGYWFISPTYHAHHCYDSTDKAEGVVRKQPSANQCHAYGGEQRPIGWARHVDRAWVNQSFWLCDRSPCCYSVFFHNPVMISALNLGYLREVIRWRRRGDCPLHSRGVPRIVSYPARSSAVHDVVYENKEGYEQNYITQTGERV